MPAHKFHESTEQKNFLSQQHLKFLADTYENLFYQIVKPLQNADQLSQKTVFFKTEMMSGHYFTIEKKLRFRHRSVEADI